jgi:hypothetical protein
MTEDAQYHRRSAQSSAEFIAKNLMSRDEVAEALGIDPESVRSTLRRYGVTELRGYPRVAVNHVERVGQGARTDLLDDE